VITFGPISALPPLQKLGIGSALINHTKKLAAEMGYRAIVIFGNPAYYHRFGFMSAESFGITTADEVNFEAFMAMELYAGALSGMSGKFYSDNPWSDQCFAAAPENGYRLRADQSYEKACRGDGI